MGSTDVLDQLQRITESMRQEFEAERRVLSFEEYLELFAKEPQRHSRDAALYVRDAFDHFGKEQRELPWGKSTHFKLFDLDWLTPEDARRERLVGQTEVQNEIYRVLNNFAREGRPNRLPLLHGPNGSAKSTLARCLMRALEHYSTLEEGALYRFHWVFPSRKTTRGAIGFGEKQGSVPGTDSFAHLPEESIDARLIDEMRDHPLLLLPKNARQEMLDTLIPDASKKHSHNSWLWHGSLSHKNRAVFEALLSSADGDLAEVLRHVQVERYFISRRYRVGAVTLGPELNIDARERQVTADRSLAALPSSLQAVTLFEAHGELLEAAGGVLEFSDLLKRPLDAFKYLQITIETGEFALPSQNVRTNCVMLASANELELTAFRAHPEFESFRGRLELIKSPYLCSWRDEKEIYDAQIAPQIRTHVAPHATTVAAMFAVLTRLRAPQPEQYPREARALVRGLTAFEKMDLYAEAQAPGRLDADSAKLLLSLVGDLYHEGASQTPYEGSLGASPREMRTLLLDAAQDEDYFGLSPFAVLKELDDLCAREGEFGWLNEETNEGGYHDHAEFRKLLRQRLLDTVEDEFRVASGLVDESRYNELFDKYIYHVTFWLKKEKVRNPITGGYEDPDTNLMDEVEGLLKLPDEPDTLRESWMNRIAAWAIDHPGEPVDNQVIFKDAIQRLRDSVFEERRETLAALCRDVVLVLREEGGGLSDDRRGEVREVVKRLEKDFSYVAESARDAAAHLVHDRFDAS